MVVQQHVNCNLLLTSRNRYWHKPEKMCDVKKYKKSQKYL
nr:MAG TPA: hypothetical protein [Caudoviricetes sp.]DAV96494.1 MAG TPA: hypothetical protein [Caudoviricetes sp.]DAX07152.1 MAG TPA: hypothetical protein [Bacteriophage sp.]